MAQNFYANGFAQSVGILLQEGTLLDVEVKLWQDGEVTPSRSTTIAELDAAQCNFSGYSKVAIADVGPPVFLPDGGVALYLHATFIATTATPFVENIVGGYWVETATGALVAVGAFDDPIPVAAPGQGVPMTAALRLFQNAAI